MPAQRLCIEYVAPSGVQTQTQKVPSNAVTDLSIPTTGMGLNIYASVTSTDKTRSLTTTDRSYNEDTYGLHEILYSPTRHDEFRDHSDSDGPISLSSTSILPTTNQVPAEFQQFKNSIITRSARLTALVDVATEEWSSFKSDYAHSCDHHGRVPVRMGRSDGPTVYTGPVVRIREIESYQLLRTKDCFNCSTALEKSAEKTQSHYSWTTRQL